MSSNNCLGEIKSEKLLSKRKRSSSSYLSIDDVENSMNLEFEDSGFNKSKQLSRGIISMFQKKSKKMKRYQAMTNLFSEIEDESLNIGEKETKKQRCHCRNRKSFKRKPLDEYEEREQQISREEPSPPYYPSDNRKIDLNRKVLRSALKVRNNNSPVICKKKVSFAPLPCKIHSSLEESSSEEENLYELTDDESYIHTFKNESVAKCVKESNFDSSIVMNQDRNAVNIPNVLTSSKSGGSFDSFAPLSTNVRTNEKNALSCNASEDHEVFWQEIFSDTIDSMERLNLTEV